MRPAVVSSVPHRAAGFPAPGWLSSPAPWPPWPDRRWPRRADPAEAGPPSPEPHSLMCGRCMMAWFRSSRPTSRRPVGPEPPAGFRGVPGRSGADVAASAVRACGPGGIQSLRSADAMHPAGNPLIKFNSIYKVFIFNNLICMPHGWASALDSGNGLFLSPDSRKSDACPQAR